MDARELKDLLERAAREMGAYASASDNILYKHGHRQADTSRLYALQTELELAAADEHLSDLCVTSSVHDS